MLRHRISRLHYGYNRDARPKDWVHAGGGKVHQHAMDLFIAFVRTCFSEWDS